MTDRSRWIVLAALAFAGGFGPAAAKTVVFLGDSLTAGYGLPETQAYPWLIQEFIRRDGLDWTVVNGGVSGDTSRGGLERLNWILRVHPDLVFVALGANDGLRGLSPEETRENLQKILDSLKAARAGAVLAGMQLPTNYGASYRNRFKALYPSLAAKNHLELFPFLLEGVAMKPGLNQADGVHPNAAGHRIIAERVYRFLKPRLQKAP